ncbi:MAG: tetratricopeptide repeat protein [Ferruginibacter sp.]
MKQQLILTGAGVLLLAGLLVFSRTGPVKKTNSPDTVAQQAPAFDISQYIRQQKKKLNSNQVNYVTAIENGIGRGDVANQQINADNQLAAFWKDSANQFEPYIYYLSKASKLENSEKTLTFAARNLEEYLRNEQDAAKRIWMADEAIDLFEKAILLNPSDKSLLVEMGACYVYGYAATGRADKAMKGILMLKDLADKDSTNLKANMLVGIGGVISGQYDKAIARLTNVVNQQPDNVEAISYLADAYAGKGDKTAAVSWLERSKKILKDPGFTKAVDERINEINK